jgi:hypothetical protein
MEDQTLLETPAPAPVAAAPGLLATKTPGAVSFLVAVLLFFMPFIDIKCNDMSLRQVSGFQIATGFDPMDKGSSKFMPTEGDNAPKKETTKRQDPNLFALVALGLGVLGIALSLTRSKAAVGIAMVAALGAAASLIGMMLDLKKSLRTTIPDSSTGNKDSFEEGMANLTRSMTQGIKIEFTPWFWVAVAAFAVAAFFSFRRMQSMR